MSIREDITWLVRLSQGYRLRLLLDILLGVISVGLSLLFISLSKGMVDAAVSSGDGVSLVMVVAIVVTMLLQLLATVWRGRIESYASTRMMNGLRERLFYRVMLSRWSGKEQFHTGDITTRREGDVRKVCETLCEKLPLVAITGVEFVLSFLFMMMLDSRLAWILLFIMPLTLLLSKSYMRRMRSLTHSIREVDSSVQAHIQEQVQHRNVINSMGHTMGAIEALRGLSGRLFDHTMKRTNYTLFSRSVVRFGFMAGYLTVFIWGVDGLSSGVITFGVMTAFLQLVAKVQVPIVELSSQLANIAQTTSSIDRLGELDGLEIEEQGEPRILSGEIGVELRDVTFGYETRDVLSHFNCNFEPNKLHIIVGETGSGKSTVLRLMLGFLSPSNGSIELYSESARERCSPLTRGNFVYVPQGNTLISGTIRDNILLGDPTATEDDIQRVLHVAVADFVLSLPDGLDTLCGERGAGLSEGEAQRVAIARGLLRKGGVLLLDEPTSALDSTTERLLIERLTDYAKSRTMIMVTHRERASEISSSVIRLKRE